MFFCQYLLIPGRALCPKLWFLLRLLHLLLLPQTVRVREGRIAPGQALQHEEDHIPGRPIGMVGLQEPVALHERLGGVLLEDVINAGDRHLGGAGNNELLPQRR